MFKMSGRAAMIRATMLAGAAAAALGGFTATAQALPAMAPVAAPGGVEAVQYDGNGYPHHMRHHGYRYGYGHHRHRYGMNAHPRHPGHAGLYDCGPGGKNTRLSRKACGGNNRFQHLQQPY